MKESKIEKTLKVEKAEQLEQSKKAYACKEEKKNNCKWHLVDYDPMWMNGEVYCETCGLYVRDFDAG